MSEDSAIPTKIYEYRIVKNGDIRFFHSRDCLPIELTFVKYMDSNWVRLYSPQDKYEIDVQYGAVVNLLPEFSPQHRHIHLSYSERHRYPVHVLIPKNPIVTTAQETIYRYPPRDGEHEVESPTIDNEELRSQLVDYDDRSGWEETWPEVKF